MNSSTTLDLLSQVLDANAVKTIGQELGTDQETAERAVSAALPTLLGALSRQADDTQRAESLHNAISRDHDGSVLDDVQGFLNGSSGSGADILGHILGGRQARVEKGVGQIAGLDASSAAKLMGMLAPLVLGAIGKQQRQKQLSSGGLTDLLRNERSTVESGASSSLLGALLDADGDGDFDLSDILKHGTGLLGSFFRRS